MYEYTFSSNGGNVLVVVHVSPTHRAGAPRLTPLMHAVESGEPISVSRILEELTLDERRRELTVECAGTGGRQGNVAGLPLSSPPLTVTVMLPIFHAASLGNLDVFLAVLRGLKDSLSDDSVGLQEAACDTRCGIGAGAGPDILSRRLLSLRFIAFSRFNG